MLPSAFFGFNCFHNSSVQIFSRLSNVLQVDNLVLIRENGSLTHSKK